MPSGDYFYKCKRDHINTSIKQLTTPSTRPAAATTATTTPTVAHSSNRNNTNDNSTKDENDSNYNNSSNKNTNNNTTSNNTKQLRSILFAHRHQGCGGGRRFLSLSTRL